MNSKWQSGGEGDGETRRKTVLGGIEEKLRVVDSH